MNNSSPRGYALASILFIVGSLALASPWLLGIVTIPWDAKAEEWPQFAFLARSLASGESPFWTPNIYAGLPNIADPQALIFSPSFLLMALFSGQPGFIMADAVVFAMLILAGLALMLFFRDRGWRPEGALVAAFAFSFGGSAAWRLQHIGQVTSLCWFAIALLLLDRALDRSSIVAGFLAGVIAGFMALGRDQVGLLGAYALAIYALWHAFSGASLGARLRSAVAPLCAGFVGGVLVTAIPIAFSLTLASDSNRPAIDFAGAGRGSLPPLALLSGVVANLFGVDGPYEKYWGPPSSLVWGATDLALARNMATIYFGALPVAALTCLGIARGALRERTALVFTALIAFMGLYAVGRYTPAFGLLYHLPGVEFYRRPADATFMLVAVLAIAAGYCVHRAVERGEGLNPAGPLLVAGLLGVCAFVAVDRERLEQATLPLLTGLFFLGAAVALLVVLPRLSARWPAMALIAVAALMSLDLAVNNKPNESTGLPPQAYDELRFNTHNDTITLIRRRLADGAAADRRDRVEIAGVGFQWPNIGMVQGFDNDLGYNPLRLKLFADVTHIGDQVAEMEQRVFSPLFPSYRSPMADLLGVRLIVTGAPPQSIDKALKPGDLNFIARTNDAFVYENPRALPRVLLATKAVAADFGKLIAEGPMPDLDYRQSVLLEHPPTDTGEARPPGEAKIAAYHNTDILIEARAPGGGYVVLNDIWHPWWQATVDGKPADILRANVMFRAVEIPPGDHIVRFAFHPIEGLWKQMTGPARAR